MARAGSSWGEKAVAPRASGAFPTSGSDQSRKGQGSRIGWLDTVKGIGIVLVVIGHAIGGVIDSLPKQALPELRTLFLAVYLVHMPLFFFLAGLLVQRRVGRSRKAFAIDLVISVAYPYFLWSVIQYSVIFAAGSLVNTPVSSFWPAILNLPFSSISQFWFLYVLFFLHLAALLIIPRGGVRMLLILAILAKLALVLLPITGLFKLVMVHGVFYALGAALSVEGVRKWLPAPERGKIFAAVLTCLALGLILLAVWVTIDRQGTIFWSLRSPEITGLGWRAYMVPVALTGIVAILALAMQIKAQLARYLGYLGERTMAIFVLHVLFIAGTRIVLTKLFGPIPPAAMAVIGTGVGLIGPLIVFELSRRYTRSRALGLG